MPQRQNKRKGVLTYDDAGALLGVGLRQVQWLIRRGDLVRRATGRILPTGHHERGVSRASVERLLRQRGGRPARRTAPARAEGLPVQAACSGAAERVPGRIVRIVIEVHLGSGDA